MHRATRFPATSEAVQAVTPTSATTRFPATARITLWWASGTGVGRDLMSFAWTLLGAWLARRLARQTEPASVALQAALRAVVGPGKRPPALRVTDRLGQPVALGLWHPVILLPRRLAVQASPQEVEAAIRHEWDHVCRGDLCLLALSRWLMVLLFAHPLYWWLRRRLRLDQEALADAAAADRAGRIAFAEMLVQWARHGHGMTASAILVASSAGCTGGVRVGMVGGAALSISPSGLSCSDWPVCVSGSGESAADLQLINSTAVPSSTTTKYIFASRLL